MLVFDENTGFSVSEVTDIRSDLATEWINAFKETGRPDLNTDPETPQGQIIDSETAAIHQKDSELAFLANQFNPKTSSGIWQDALGKIYFLTRKQAINSEAVCTLTGRLNTVVPAGAQIRSSYDQTLWTLAEDVTINTLVNDTYTAQGTFTCQTAGAVVAGAGTLNQIVTTVAGWDTVSNTNAALVGSEVETQAAFENRRYNSVAKNSRSAEASVYARVADISDVIATYVTGNRTNIAKTVDGYTLSPHSIYVAVIGGEDEEIAQAIYNSLSAGCDYNGNTTVEVTDENTGAIENVTFMRPSDYPIYFRVTVQNDGNLPDDYENIIKEAIQANFYGTDTETTINGEAILRIIMNSDVYASRFLPSILNAGVNQILAVELSTDGSTWQDFIHIPITASPSVDASNISIVVNS
jgi:uncharacterized phage protein gp47/JayE